MDIDIIKDIISVTEKQDLINRKSSKRNIRIAPNILQKHQAILSVVKQLNKWMDVNSYYLRDLVSYTYENGEKHTGYVTALYPE